MQVEASFSKRIVVISGGGSAASALPQAPNPPKPATPAKAALVRNRRRVWIGMETTLITTSRVLGTAGQYRPATAAAKAKVCGRAPRPARPGRRAPRDLR